MASISSYDIYDGKRGLSFRELVLKLTENTGQISVDHYLYAKRIREKEDELAEVQGWNEQTAMTKAKESNKKRAEEIAEFNREREVRLQRLGALIPEVKDWKPPTDDHRWIKEHLLERLEAYIELDGQPIPPPILLTGPEYRTQSMRFIEEELASFRAEYAEKLLELNKRDVWSKALLDSLPE